MLLLKGLNFFVAFVIFFVFFLSFLEIVNPLKLSEL